MLTKKNLKAEVNSVQEFFEYRHVGSFNGQMMNVLQAENRMLDFHIHEKADEVFYCIEGEFDIELEDGLVHLTEGDFIIIPKGTLHRSVCKGLVKCLLVETEGTLNAENTGGTYKG